MKKILKYIFLTSLIIYIILPILTNIILSISGIWQWPNLMPRNITYNHFKEVLSQTNFFKSLFNTIIIGIFTTLFNYILAIPSSYYLAKLKSKYKYLLIGFIILPIISPPILILINLDNFLLKTGLTDTYLGVIISHMIPSLPYMFIILYLGFDKINFNYEKIFLSLGEKPLKGFFNITLFQIKRSLILGGIMTFLISISQYLSTLLIGGGSILTLNLLLTPFISGGDSRLGAALGIILITICFSFIIIYEKTLIGGKYAKNQ